MAPLVSDADDRLLAEREHRTDAVMPAAAAALHGLFDAPGPPPGTGEPLPPLWHWLAFLPDAPQRLLGPDGHPISGSFIPDNRPPRRMFAGGRLHFPGRVPVGAVIERNSQATGVTTKEGRSGPLRFVEVTHQVTWQGELVISDVQDIVYRPEGGPTPAPTAVEFDATGWDLEIGMDVTETVLFRFSALTYNAHRIHYDVGYATGVEGYPGLVIHGPLQAIGLAEVVRRLLPDVRMTSLTFRGVAPAFGPGFLRFLGRQVEDTVELQAVSPAGQVSMTATATVAPSPS